MKKNVDIKKCKHCKEPIKFRNPSSYCDHLYYPENCDVCKPEPKCKCCCHRKCDCKEYGARQTCSQCKPLQSKWEKFIDEIHNCGFNQRVDCKWYKHEATLKYLLSSQQQIWKKEIKKIFKNYWHLDSDNDYARVAKKTLDDILDLLKFLEALRREE